MTRTEAQRRADARYDKKRQRKDTPVLTRFPDDELAHLDEIRQAGETRQKAIRRAVREAKP